jgi:hypothetical protein
LVQGKNDLMPQTAIIEICEKYKVYTEHYLNSAADKTIILVNGSLATTASFAQTAATDREGSDQFILGADQYADA